MSNIKLKLHEYYSLDSEINGLKNPQTGEVITEGLLAEKLGLSVEEKGKAIVNFGEKYKTILLEKELTAEEYINDIMNSGNTVLIDKVIELIKKCHNG